MFGCRTYKKGKNAFDSGGELMGGTSMKSRYLSRTGVRIRAAAAALLLCLSGDAGLLCAQDRQVNFKVSIWLPPSHPVVSTTKSWLASVENASGGSIKGTVFPAEQLGKAFDHYDMARDGIADMTYVSPGYQPGRFPIFDAAQLPFTITDGKKGTAAVDAWYRHYAGSEMKDTQFCLAFTQDPGALHAKKKIVLPEEIRGLKIRPANAIVGQFVTLLGGTNVQASASEARDVLERGVADAITFPWNSMFLLGVDRAAKFHMDVPLYASSFVFVINKARYDGLSPAQRKVIDDHCTNEWAQRVGGEWADYEILGRVKSRETSGHTVYSLTAGQLLDWQKAAEPLRVTWAGAVRKAGGDPDAVMADLKSNLDKYQNAN
jgi:TRAP-type C4-dicarboxylate transport system substrate-binding protein